MGVSVAIGLGSNRGGRRNNLSVGIRGLRCVVDRMEMSPVYETEPAYFADQPRFLNAACIAETQLEPSQLLAALQAIERAAGRSRTVPRFGPRVLDLDLLLYGDEVIDLPDLVVPHPRLHERNFVLIPLRDIAPDRRVPPSHGRGETTIRELAEAVSPEGVEATNLRLEDV